MQPKDLYTVCVVPSYAEDSFRDFDYSPWIVTHAEHDKLTPGALALMRKTWFDGVGHHDDEPEEDFDVFMEWLDGRDGYVVNYTAMESWFAIVD